jgi:hypothetical protein
MYYIRITTGNRDSFIDSIIFVGTDKYSSNYIHQYTGDTDEYRVRPV